MTADQIQRRLAHGRDLAGRGITHRSESAAQTPVTRTKLLPVDWRLLERLDSYGPRGIWPAVPELAARLGVSDRTVQRSLARLEAAGRVERVAVFERDDDPEWQKRGRPILRARRQTSNTYRLTAHARLPVTGEAMAAWCEQHGTPVRVTGAGDTTFDPLSSVGAAQTPVTRPEMDTSRVTPGTRVSCSSGGDTYQGPPEPIEITIEPARSALLDHHPDVGEVLGVIRRRFGEVLVLSGPASYRMARGRLIDLATESSSDLRQAVDQLSRDTCLDGGCRPRQRCRRHRRRTGRATAQMAAAPARRPSPTRPVRQG